MKQRIVFTHVVLQWESTYGNLHSKEYEISSFYISDFLLKPTAIWKIKHHPPIDIKQLIK